MLVVYNIFQLLALLILGPWLALWVLLSPKYRGRIPRRLGWGLADLVRGLRPGPRLWVHALSVGEAASARPLLRALRREMPELVIIFSTTTSGGEAYARSLADLIDCRLAFPLDLYWVVDRFVRLLRPDLFVLVETDFWPNVLAVLARRRVPAMLVNGRITTDSMAWYRRGRLLFAPLFAGFCKITMQMAADAERLLQLGVEGSRIVTCGNLKYDMETAGQGGREVDLAACGLSGRPLLVAGSTHPGEEAILLAAFVALGRQYPGLSLVLAPRDIGRGAEVLELAQRHGLGAARRTAAETGACQVLVLDTLGELAAVYRQADLAFVGGSLVAAGGHNPLEPAAYGTPVLFGPDMRDFAEISRDLQAAGAARAVTTADLATALTELLAHEERRLAMGRAARQLVAVHQGAAERHVALIRGCLTHG